MWRKTLQCDNPIRDQASRPVGKRPSLDLADCLQSPRRGSFTDQGNLGRAPYEVLDSEGQSLRSVVVHQCVTCLKFEGKPCPAPPPPHLPKFRVEEEAPFTNTGVDFAGPMYVKSSEPGSSEKVWLCLYTCSVVRAIHLDIVLDMTTAAFLRRLRRFSARRGLPRMMISDNGRPLNLPQRLSKLLCPTPRFNRVSGISLSNG